MRPEAGGWMTETGILGGGRGRGRLLELMQYNDRANEQRLQRTSGGGRAAGEARKRGRRRERTHFGALSEEDESRPSYI